jgi:hypothetical protein
MISLNPRAESIGARVFFCEPSPPQLMKGPTRLREIFAAQVGAKRHPLAPLAPYPPLRRGNRTPFRPTYRAGVAIVLWYIWTGGMSQKTTPSTSYHLQPSSYMSHAFPAPELRPTLEFFFFFFFI